MDSGLAVHVKDIQWLNGPWCGGCRYMKTARALVAWNLRRVRVGKGLSQERLAFDARVDRAYVGSVERGEQNPTIDVLDRLSKTLKVHIAEFFVEPAKGAQPPQPLPGGRRRR
jgi:DNA-binding XRE family transcriptional regulator